MIERAMTRNPAATRDSAGKPLDIAVVGGGITGLGAAWLLARRHRVTVFESEPRLGGHSHTVEIPGPDGSMPVDTGFIVYNERNYPNLVALFHQLGIKTRASEMSFAVSADDGAFEYAGTSIAGLLAQRRNLLRPRFWRMMRDVVRFYRKAPHDLAAGACRGQSLGDYLERGGYSMAFVRDHLLPMGAAIWSSSPCGMSEHPAEEFVRFFLNHGLLQVEDRPQWRTVAGGSRAYVSSIRSATPAVFLTSTPVRAIRRTDDGVIVTSPGTSRRFDRVVIAAHADHALSMLADPSPLERSLLGAFRYQTNEAVLHRDPALMPKRRAAWSSWNYLSRSGQLDEQRVCVTYWMNRLQSLPDNWPAFVTLNPAAPISDDLVFGRYDYEHPLFNQTTAATQRRLWELQGQRQTWFCGSYWGAGFHEDGLQAGLAAAEAAGGAQRPWPTAGHESRIHHPAPVFADAAE